MQENKITNLDENLNLDKKTLVFLRYIAILGQFATINLVYFYLELQFNILASHAIIFLGLCSNIFLQIKIKQSLLKDRYSAIVLIYDILQLSILLYFTGGITNPFSLLLIVPAIVSSTFLSMGTTITLVSTTTLSLVILTFSHHPLPGSQDYLFKFPSFYLAGILISILIGLFFLSYFGIRFSTETKKRSDAGSRLQQVIAKEYELESLGGQAAAAAHSLGTPLATISVIARELKKDIGEKSTHSSDLDLLISQTKRCSDILKQISRKEIIEDKFFSLTTFETLLDEIVVSFEETTEKNIDLILADDNFKAEIQRSPEMIYGLRNFIGNSVKFANKNIYISIKSNKDLINITIEDDGPGFPEDVIKILGEPYIKSKSREISSQSGTGLGTFLGKTLLERKGAELKFFNGNKLKGACVSIKWKTYSLK